MNDPHVVALHYRIETPETVTYDSPPAVEEETPQFTARLTEGRATVTLKEHFATAEAARELVDPYLRAWELAAALQFGRVELCFVFERPDIIDRNPTPGTITGAVCFLASASLSGTAIVRTIRREYPAPPQGFVVSLDAETLWHRYEGYTEGREPLLSMAYFCLTLLEARAGSRLNAVRLYGIHKNALNKLGELTALGDVQTARKIDQQGKSRPLTAQETIWVQAAVRALIRRVGEAEWASRTGAQLRQITMVDLPKV